jgi:hypothetical protein
VQAISESSTVGAGPKRGWEAPIGTAQSARPSRGSLLACAAALLGGVAFYVVFIARASFVAHGQVTYSLFDDAMISMTYARNLASGYGLVWVAGESPVEGYTNFLWTIVMSLPHLAGLPDRLASLPVMALGGVLLSATSLLAMQIARRLSRSSFTAPLAVAATALSYPLLFWTLRGLEVGLIACLVAAACLLALRLAERPSARDLGLLCAVLVCAALTRTDAVVFAVVVLAFLAVSSRRARRDAVMGALATVSALAAHTAFRLFYYGAALPNTYYLKVSGHPLSQRAERGAEVLWDLVSSTLWAPVGLALALLVVKRSSLGRPAQLLMGVVAAAMAYSVYVGGDVWEYADFANRFVAVALPALFVLALLGIEALLAARGPDVRLGLGALAGSVVAFLTSRLGRPHEGFVAIEPYFVLAALGLLLVGGQCVQRRSADARTGLAVLAGLLLIVSANGRSVAEWALHGGLHVRDDEIMVRKALAIRAASPPEARVAVVWAGAIPYFSRRPAIDLFGKSDPVIAHLAPGPVFLPGHDKWDFEYSIGRLRPDLVDLTWNISLRERQQLDEWGYEKVAGYYVRRGAEIDRRELRAPWR